MPTNSVRQNILTKLGTNLAFITSTNGYTNTVKSALIKQGWKSAQEINDYPYIYYGLHGEQVTDRSENDSVLYYRTSIYIVVTFKDSTQTLTAQYEKWLRDFKRFIQIDKNITKGKTIGLNEVEGVDNWNYSGAGPYLDYVKNIGTVQFEIEVIYFENFNKGI